METHGDSYGFICKLKGPRGNPINYYWSRVYLASVTPFRDFRKGAKALKTATPLECFASQYAKYLAQVHPARQNPYAGRRIGAPGNSGVCTDDDLPRGRCVRATPDFRQQPQSSEVGQLRAQALDRTESEAAARGLAAALRRIDATVARTLRQARAGQSVAVATQRARQAAKDIFDRGNCAAKLLMDEEAHKIARLPVQLPRATELGIADADDAEDADSDCHAAAPTPTPVPPYFYYEGLLDDAPEGGPLQECLELIDILHGRLTTALSLCVAEELRDDFALTGRFLRHGPRKEVHPDRLVAWVGFCFDELRARAMRIVTAGYGPEVKVFPGQGPLDKEGRWVAAEYRLQCSEAAYAAGSSGFDNAVSRGRGGGNDDDEVGDDAAGRPRRSSNSPSRDWMGQSAAEELAALDGEPRRRASRASRVSASSPSSHRSGNSSRHADADAEACTAAAHLARTVSSEGGAVTPAAPASVTAATSAGTSRSASTSSYHASQHRRPSASTSLSSRADDNARGGDGFPASLAMSDAPAAQQRTQGTPQMVTTSNGTGANAHLYPQPRRPEDGPASAMAPRNRAVGGMSPLAHAGLTEVINVTPAVPPPGFSFSDSEDEEEAQEAQEAEASM